MNLQIEFQILRVHEGFYWRTIIDDEFGPSYGPFNSEDAARRDAEIYIKGKLDELKRTILRAAGSIDRFP